MYRELFNLFPHFTKFILSLRYASRLIIKANRKKKKFLDYERDRGQNNIALRNAFVSDHNLRRDR